MLKKKVARERRGSIFRWCKMIFCGMGGGRLVQQQQVGGRGDPKEQTAQF
jgi:hypothetical protein